MSNKNRRKIESILREPLTRARLVLNGKIRNAQSGEDGDAFTLDELKKFLTSIRSTSEDYKKEVLNIIEAVETGKAPRAPRFDTPETQLAWGSALAYLLLNPDQMKTWEKPLEPGDLKSSEVWKQLVTSRTAYQELLSHAHHVREILRDKDVKYGWGDPGSGFTFDRKKKVISVDLMQSLVVGFEHARADVNREIGYTLLSQSYPRRMQELFREMQPLMKKQRLAQNKDKKKRGPKLKPEEFKQLQLLSAEWQLRQKLFAAAEENVTSRFVSNMAQHMLQDFSVSLNNTAVTFRGVGLHRLPQGEEISDELRRYYNLCNAVQLSFFQNNDLFENTDDGWYKVGIDPNLVRKTKTIAKNPDGDEEGIAHADFKELRELCGGPKGLEHLQPKAHERLYGWDSLLGRIAKADKDRKTIIEKIWEEFGEDLIQKILKQQADDLDKQLEEAKKQQQQNQDGDGDDDNDQDGDDGQENDGDGQEGGSPQKGQKGKKGKKGQKGQRGQPQGDMDDMDDDGDSDDADGDDNDQDGQQGKKDKKDKKGQKDKKDQKGKKGDKSDKSDKSDQGDDADGDGQDQEGQDGKKDKGKGKGKKDNLGADEEETVPVEGAGDMQAAKGATEDPADELDPNGDGNDADGEGDENDGDGNDADGNDGDGQEADGDDGSMTEGEIEKEIAKQEAEEAAQQEGQGDDADGQDADGKGKPKQGKKPSRQAGHHNGKSLEELSKQDWTDYNRRIAELQGPINRVRKLFKGVQERQLQRKPTVSPKLDILPENGEVKERFNMEAHRNLTIKKMTGQVEEKDLSRFHVDQVKMVPTEIDIVIMIDGSGSMNGTPINSALQASAIMFEAAASKDMKMNVYVCMWGNEDPPIIIYPGADRVKIGQAMQAARTGLNSGTDFAPAVKKVAKVIGEQRGKSGTLSGFTHLLVLSDGDMFDASQATEMIKTMFTHSDKVTIDAAVIGRSGTNMETMAKAIKGSKPFQDMGVTVGSNPETIPMEIVGLLLDKVRKCGSFVAVPNNVKRRQMKKAHNKMGPK